MPTPNIPMTPQVIEFLAKLLIATREGQVEWETTGKPTLVRALLDGGYCVYLEQVPDFDGQDEQPDHVLRLEQDGNTVFFVDRRSVDNTELSTALGEPIEYTYRYFLELWGLAVHKARKIADHLTAVNRLLDSKIGSH